MSRALAIAALLISRSCGPGGQAAPHLTASLSVPRESLTMMDARFESAVASTGQAYLEADRRLREGGEQAVLTLRENLARPDPVARLLARTTLDWLEGSGPDYQAVLDYLEYIGKLMATTPVGTPPPLGVAGHLSDTFGARAVDLLALRLVKCTDWPNWKVVSAIFYLKEQARTSATEALLRFAAETGRDDWRDFAVEAIEATRDPNLATKIAFERQYQASRGKQLPPALEALGAPRP